MIKMVATTAEPIHHCNRVPSISSLVSRLTRTVNGISQNGTDRGVGDDGAEGALPDVGLVLVPGRRFRLRHLVLLDFVRVVRTFIIGWSRLRPEV